MRTLMLLMAALAAATVVNAQERDVVITGGWIFAATGDQRVQNPGILVRAGKIVRIGGNLDAAPDAERVTLTGEETLIPGMFDLHAHYAVDFYGEGRIDDTTTYPALFLANGVTSTFPAGEMQPEAMRALRLRIDAGQQPGPRLYNSGPYFGTARPGWQRAITREQLYAEVDHWVAQGARGFKAKGIAPDHLQWLIERAHFHGLTVTGHLESGFRNSVNPRDAILMGIDRVEHFLGGDAIAGDRAAYSSLDRLDATSPDMRRIAGMYVASRTYYNATLSAYGYYGRQDPVVFERFVDEQRFLTPELRAELASRPARRVMEQFETIYWIKRAELKAFYDAGGGDLITLGTDHPSWGEFLSPFSVHRELHSFVLSGIPTAAALRMATINGARALGVGDRLGTIEVGKWADLVVLRGNPLADIRATRNPRVVIRSGRVYDPAALMRSVEGKMGGSAHRAADRGQ